MSDIAKISADWAALKFGDLDYLIREFKNNEKWVMENEKAHRLLLDRLKGEVKKGRKLSKEIFTEHEQWVRGAHITKAIRPELPWKSHPDYEDEKPSVCSLLAKELGKSSAQVYKVVVTQVKNGKYPEADSLGRAMAKMITEAQK